GPNGIFEDDRQYYSRTDDFDVLKVYVDYFYKTENQVNAILSKAVNVGNKPFPKDEAELRRMLTDGKVDFDTIVDGYGRPAYITSIKQTAYTDKTIVENGKQKITPVTNEILTLHMRSKGEDGIANTQDDFDLATFSSVTTEISKYTGYSKA